MLNNNDYDTTAVDKEFNDFVILYMKDEKYLNQLRSHGIRTIHGLSHLTKDDLKACGFLMGEAARLFNRTKAHFEAIAEAQKVAKEFTQWLVQQGLTPEAAGVFVKEGVTSCELLVHLNVSDLTDDFHLQTQVAKNLIAAAKAKIAPPPGVQNSGSIQMGDRGFMGTNYGGISNQAHGQQHNDQRRGNFGAGGAYAENGTAIGTISGGVNNIGK